MDFIKFLGTAGARFVVTKQLRASGGIWFSLRDTQLMVDPGPGCLVRLHKSRPALDPRDLDGIYLSHRHLDHSGDINIMLEAMTEGGFNRKGALFAPEDALEEDPVVLEYLRGFVDRVEILREKGEHVLKNLVLKIPVRHRHRSETYGFRISCPDCPVIAYLPDTAYFPELTDSYRGAEILIINTVLYQPRPELDHLSLPEAEAIIKGVNPRKAILTHFGMTMLKNRIWEKTPEISKRLGVEVIAAADGMTIEI